MRSAYKGYIIVTETPKHPAGGWTAEVSVQDENGLQSMGTLNLGRDLTFATVELAEKAALLLGRAWIDRLSSS